MEYISGYTDYTIDTHGNILCIETGVLLNFLVCHDYYTVELSKNKISEKLYLHHLLAVAFIDNPDNYDFVNHIDKNRTNNNLNNLQWCSRSQYNKYNKCNKYDRMKHQVLLAYIKKIIIGV